jgi:hypothetical protein
MAFIKGRICEAKSVNFDSGFPIGALGNDKTGNSNSDLVLRTSFFLYNNSLCYLSQHVVILLLKLDFLAANPLRQVKDGTTGNSSLNTFKQVKPFH